MVERGIEGMKETVREGEESKTLARSFEEVFGVTLRDCEEHPEVMKCLVGGRIGGVQTRSDTGKDFGRGYPFMGEARSSAKEADARNLEILSTW